MKGWRVTVLEKELSPVSRSGSRCFPATMLFRELGGSKTLSQSGFIDPIFPTGVFLAMTSESGGRSDRQSSQEGKSSVAETL